MKYDFDNSIGRLSQIVSKGIGKHICEEFEKAGYQISPGEWTVIAYLYNYRKQSQAELGVATGMNKVAVTRLITKLENEGIIIRRAGQKDKRINLLSLSVDGEILYNKLLPLADKAMHRSYLGFNDKEIDQLAEKLKRIMSNM